MSHANRVVWRFEYAGATHAAGQVTLKHAGGQTVVVSGDANGYFTNPAQVDVVSTSQASIGKKGLVYLSDDVLSEQQKGDKAFVAQPAARYYRVDVELPTDQSAFEVVAHDVKFIGKDATGNPASATSILSTARGAVKTGGGTIFPQMPNVETTGPKPALFVTEEQFAEFGFEAKKHDHTDVAITYYAFPDEWDESMATVIGDPTADPGTFVTLVWSYRTGKYARVIVNFDDARQCAGIRSSNYKFKKIEKDQKGQLALSESFIRTNGLWPSGGGPVADPKTPVVQGAGAPT